MSILINLIIRLTNYTSFCRHYPHSESGPAKFNLQIPMESLYSDGSTQFASLILYKLTKSEIWTIYIVDTHIYAYSVSN